MFRAALRKWNSLLVGMSIACLVIIRLLAISRDSGLPQSKPDFSNTAREDLFLVVYYCHEAASKGPVEYKLSGKSVRYETANSQDCAYIYDALMQLPNTWHIPKTSQDHLSLRWKRRRDGATPANVEIYFDPNHLDLGIKAQILKCVELLRQQKHMVPGSS
jgi:hypothetical protein